MECVPWSIRELALVADQLLESAHESEKAEVGEAAEERSLARTAHLPVAGV